MSCYRRIGINLRWIQGFLASVDDVITDHRTYSHLITVTTRGLPSPNGFNVVCFFWRYTGQLCFKGAETEGGGQGEGEGRDVFAGLGAVLYEAFLDTGGFPMANV